VSFGDRMGMLGAILALVSLAVTYLWPDKRWIGWLALVFAVLLFIAWGWLEIGDELPRLQYKYPVLSVVAIFLIGGCLSAALWKLVTSQSPKRPFMVTMRGTIRKAKGATEGGCATVLGLPSDTLASIDFMPVIRITNTQTESSAVKSYSLQMKDDSGKWRQFIKLNIPIPPSGVSADPVLFWASGGKLLTMTPHRSLDDELAGKSLAPGESVSGWTYFAYPADFTKTIDPDKPKFEAKVTVIDWAGHEANIEIDRTGESIHEPDAVPDINSGFQIGKDDLGRDKYKCVEYSDYIKQPGH
jgi:hypothetical protein